MSRVVHNAQIIGYQSSEVKCELLLILDEVVQTLLHLFDLTLCTRDYIDCVGNLLLLVESFPNGLISESTDKRIARIFSCKGVHLVQRRIETDRSVGILRVTDSLNCFRHSSTRMNQHHIDRIEFLVLNFDVFNQHHVRLFIRFILNADFFSIFFNKTEILFSTFNFVEFWVIRIVLIYFTFPRLNHFFWIYTRAWIVFNHHGDYMFD